MLLPLVESFVQTKTWAMSLQSDAEEMTAGGVNRL